MSNPYTKEVSGWGWKNIIRECKENVQDDGDCLVGSCYIGFMPWPSGKYYAPFATGNLKSCLKCKGTGKTTQPKHLWPKCENCQGIGVDTIQRVAFITGETPGDVYLRLCNTHKFIDDYSFVCWGCNGVGLIQLDCGSCGGLGSREAYLDELWHEAVEKVASKHGCFAFSGEGDSCDFFIGMTIDEPKDEVEEE